MSPALAGPKRTGPARGWRSWPPPPRYPWRVSPRGRIAGSPTTVGRVLAEAKVRPHRVRGKPRAVNNLAIAALIVTCATGKEIADQSAAQRRHQRSHINRINTPPAP